MNNYSQHQYRETKAKFFKYSSRLRKSQERGEFQKLTKGKQNFLIKRVKRLWEKLRILEVQLKITTAGVALACMMMVGNLSAQDQFTFAPDKNPLPPPSVFGYVPILVDIDNDGDMDLLAMEDYIGNDLFLNTGTATQPKFEKVPDAESPFSGISEEADFEIWDIIDTGDLDGDGDIDFLTYGYIIKNIGSNSNLEYKEEALALPYPGRATLGDIDGDGDLDLIRSTSADSIIAVYENIGDAANFNLYTDSMRHFAVDNWDKDVFDIDYMKALDLEGDGDLDLLLGVDTDDLFNPYGETVDIIMNIGSSTNPVFTLADDMNNPYRDLENDEVSFGDLDGDGDFDLISFDYYLGGGIQYFEVDNNTVVENVNLIPEFSDGLILPLSYFTPQFVDFDGDGDFDILTWSYYGDNKNSSYYEYQETGERLKYIRKPDISLPFLDDVSYYQIPIFVDLDQDGDQDVLVVHDQYISGTFYWVCDYHENTGSDQNRVYAKQSFPAIPPNESRYFIPSFADIDHDGDLDMFTTHRETTGYYNYSIVTGYYESTGIDPLEFTERTGDDNPLEFLTAENYDDILGLVYPLFSDIDQDGDLDVLRAAYDSILYFNNIGSVQSPLFMDESHAGPFTKITTGGPINLVDFDKDGDDDLIVHEVYGAIARYYENELVLTKNRMPQAPDLGSINIFPNPARNVINVNLNEESSGELQYNILSIEGRILKHGEVHNPDMSGSFTINTSDLTAGYYFLRMKSKQKIYMSKFVIE